MKYADLTLPEGVGVRNTLLLCLLGNEDCNHFGVTIVEDNYWEYKNEFSTYEEKTIIAKIEDCFIRVELKRVSFDSLYGRELGGPLDGKHIRLGNYVYGVIGKYNLSKVEKQLIEVWRIVQE